MAVVTLKSTAITNADATPIVQNTPLLQRGLRKTTIGTLPVANGDSIASVYRLARVRSSDRIASLSLFCTAITAAAANLGFYDTAANGGAIVGGGAQLAAAQSLAAALSGLNVTYAVTTLANAEKRVWELLGLAADPGKEYDIAATLTAAATAAGQVALHVDTVSN